MFDELMKRTTSSTEDTIDQHINKIKEERDRRIVFAKGQRKHYAKHRAAIQREKRKRK